MFSAVAIVLPSAPVHAARRTVDVVGGSCDAPSMVDRDGRPLLTTSRLVLRRFRPADLPVYAALNADPEVTRYLGGPMTREESDGIAEWAQELHDREGMGLLAVERREDAAFIGMCGLHRFHAYPDEVEIGWRLARPY